MKKMRMTMKSRAGTTLVNIMVALALFLVGVALFTQVMRLCGNIYVRSEQARASTETFIGSFYQAGGAGSRSAAENPELTSGGSGFRLNGSVEAYTASGKTMCYFRAN